jgi:hypothetical protein
VPNGPVCRRTIPPPDTGAEIRLPGVNQFTALRLPPCNQSCVGWRCPNTRACRLGYWPRSTRTFLAARSPSGGRADFCLRSADQQHDEAEVDGLLLAAARAALQRSEGKPQGAAKSDYVEDIGPIT